LGVLFTQRCRKDFYKQIRAKALTLNFANPQWLVIKCVEHVCVGVHPAHVGEEGWSRLVTLLSLAFHPTHLGEEGHDGPLTVFRDSSSHACREEERMATSSCVEGRGVKQDVEFVRKRVEEPCRPWSFEQEFLRFVFKF